MVKLFTPELLGYPDNPQHAEMVSPNDATEDNQLFVEYEAYLAIEKQKDKLVESLALGAKASATLLAESLKHQARVALLEDENAQLKNQNL